MPAAAEDIAHILFLYLVQLTGYVPLENLSKADYGVQGCPQLMAHVRKKVGLRSVCRLCLSLSQVELLVYYLQFDICIFKIFRSHHYHVFEVPGIFLELLLHLFELGDVPEYLELPYTPVSCFYRCIEKVIGLPVLKRIPLPPYGLTCKYPLIRAPGADLRPAMKIQIAFLPLPWAKFLFKQEVYILDVVVLVNDVDAVFHCLKYLYQLLTLIL